ncbi:MAG: hypothetical protein ABIQ43_02540 [Sphingomonas sp.]
MCFDRLRDRKQAGTGTKAAIRDFAVKVLEIGGQFAAQRGLRSADWVFRRGRRQGRSVPARGAIPDRHRRNDAKAFHQVSKGTKRALHFDLHALELSCGRTKRIQQTAQIGFAVQESSGVGPAVRIGSALAKAFQHLGRNRFMQHVHLPWFFGPDLTRRY